MENLVLNNLNIVPQETDCDIKDSENMFNELIDLFQDSQDGRISPRSLLESEIGSDIAAYYPEKMTVSEICSRWNVAKQQCEARYNLYYLYY